MTKRWAVIVTVDASLPLDDRHSLFHAVMNAIDDWDSDPNLDIEIGCGPWKDKEHD